MPNDRFLHRFSTINTNSVNHVVTSFKLLFYTFIMIILSLIIGAFCTDLTNVVPALLVFTVLHF